MDEREESSGEFIVAGGDSPEVLELLEKTLHEMALFVLPPVAWPRFINVGFGRDAVGGAVFLNEAADVFRAIGLVCHDDHAFQRDMRKNVRRHGAILNVPCGELDMDGVAQRVNHRVNLGGFPASAHADLLVSGTFYVPFFAPALA